MENKLIAKFLKWAVDRYFQLLEELSSDSQRLDQDEFEEKWGEDALMEGPCEDPSDLIDELPEEFTEEEKKILRENIVDLRHIHECALEECRDMRKEGNTVDCWMQWLNED